MKKLKFLLPIILTLTVIMTIFVVSQIPAKAAETSGTCGDNLTWDFNEATGTLTISGTGEMTDYEYWYTNAPSPWYSTMRNFIKTVKISEGVTSIGDCAFYDCPNLTNATIPSSVTSIGNDAFYGCLNLTNITIPSSVTTI
ncbi:MAG: leucine-rich repeat domain-containing protein, partial [Clostridia bacterium]|nr:leucine-rich repeat domain-containing protein [Clostridia bacterium]